MAVQRGGTQTIWTPVAHSPIFPRMGNVLCGFSSKASGKGVKPTGPSKEEQPPPSLFSWRRKAGFIFIWEGTGKKVCCTENCLKITQKSETRRRIARLCPGLPMFLMKAIRTHHSVDRASPGYTFYLILNTARPNVLGHDCKTSFWWGGEREILCDTPSMSPSLNHFSSQPAWRFMVVFSAFLPPVQCQDGIARYCITSPTGAASASVNFI